MLAISDFVVLLLIKMFAQTGSNPSTAPRLTAVVSLLEGWSDTFAVTQ